MTRQVLADPFGIPQASAGAAGPPRARGTKLGINVVQQIVNDVVRGVLSPGSTLPPEADLCDQFGVSRTVIRESVKVVQEKGLVRIEHGRGTQVTDPRQWNLLDDVVLTAIIAHDANLSFLDELVATRTALEADMAAAAATSHTGEDRLRISAALELMRSKADNVAEFAAADAHFHDMVMAASRNRLGRAIVNSIHDKARGSMRYHGEYNEAVIRQTLDEHQAIHDAILARDPAGASGAMRSHITGSWSRRRPQTDVEAPGSASRRQSAR
ncbi:FadR/GntR family transcriptional regulator [Catellatospora coxensis]|uniref:GntR family transcriptional regulator n=1 Tax=Catellatospora coxensis TaxID=310354 RepID=A0A8J3KS09_9ACTN|nr:FadR/GntR family transcriptional regulator [Catellatospora coxensis]GIG05143.1 GntR family transcriptional regulator [Catellatospora coxensis]